MAKAAAKKATTTATPSVERRPALAGRATSATGVKVEVLPPAERISLRAPEASVAALSKALGLTLPKKPKTSASKTGRTALWLGPDEWLVIDEAGMVGTLARWQGLPRCIRRSASHIAILRYRSPVRRQKPRSFRVARRTCRSTPSRWGRPRAPFSARPRSCCCARPMMPSGSSAGVPSRTMSLLSCPREFATRLADPGTFAARTRCAATGRGRNANAIKIRAEVAGEKDGRRALA